MAKQLTRSELLAKRFEDMSDAEREQLSAELDKGIAPGEAKPLSPANRAKFTKAKRHHRAKAEKDKFARVLVTLPPKLLRDLRAHVKHEGGTLSGFFQSTAAGVLKLKGSKPTATGRRAV